MYLEKIEIQGFKSFAKKTVLKFVDNDKKSPPSSGRAKQGSKNVGLTVIVGPNGSGKSNIADAIRWVLGEQNTKMLRGKKSGDLIFSGSMKKSSKNFAEVSLFLNNNSNITKKSGDKQSLAEKPEDKKSDPLDFTELVITRRLYREGESEYLINGNKIRLLDVTMLLAKAKFSQRGYSVVGQGMVESFLNTTPAERKEFFDEATGVKMYQIKRHDAANKLNNTRNNLYQAKQLLNEIEPRMHSLTRQMKKLERRSELERELHGLQKNYYARAWHELNENLSLENKKIINFENQERQLNKNILKFTQELERGENSQFQNEAREKWEEKLQVKQKEYTEINQQLANVRAQKNISLSLNGQGDIAWLEKRKKQLELEIEKNKKESADAQKNLMQLNKEVVVIRKEQNDFDQKIINLRKEMFGRYAGGSSDSGELLEKINSLIDGLMLLNNNIIEDYQQEKDIIKLEKKLAELRKKIEDLKELTSKKSVHNDEDLEKLNSEIITLEEEKSVRTQSYIDAQARVSGEMSKISYLSDLLEAKQGELEDIEEKIKNQSSQTKTLSPEIIKEEKELALKLVQLEDALKKINSEIKEISADEKNRRDLIISLQKKLHQEQNEYNAAVAALNEVKVSKARIEIRLEDLEKEIREETKSLREIIDVKDYQKMDESSARAEILKIKRQLELIGGIDPEIAKEHDDTKNRYDFLSKQVADLSSAIASLQKIIAQLNKTITERFDQAFVKISQQFEKYFKILFDGGQVKLEKVFAEEKKANPEDSSVRDSSEDGEEDKKTAVKNQQPKIVLRRVKKELIGIEVVATPPGKKIKSIAMLSGGERALTSIALIAAIIAVHPSPFVVLDEVDAALDEANSLRLARILEDLSKKSQFIAITHNRTIMYKADIIYGVTMGDDGVSKLLSVKIDEVQAARR